MRNSIDSEDKEYHSLEEIRIEYITEIARRCGDANYGTDCEYCDGEALPLIYNTLEYYKHTRGICVERRGETGFPNSECRLCGEQLPHKEEVCQRGFGHARFQTNRKCEYCGEKLPCAYTAEEFKLKQELTKSTN
jgi:hypothetical protein